MSCCSEMPKNPAPEGAGGFIVKDAEHPLAWALRNTLKGATIHDDGSIEFASDPLPVTGYEPDANNPLVLRPIWPECQKRMLGANTLKDRIILKMICQNPEAKHNMRLVTPADCQGCQFRVLPEKKE